MITRTLGNRNKYQENIEILYIYNHAKGTKFIMETLMHMKSYIDMVTLICLNKNEYMTYPYLMELTTK